MAPRQPTTSRQPPARPLPQNDEHPRSRKEFGGHSRASAGQPQSEQPRAANDRTTSGLVRPPAFEFADSAKAVRHARAPPLGRSSIPRRLQQSSGAGESPSCDCRLRRAICRRADLLLFLLQIERRQIFIEPPKRFIEAIDLIL